ncbi:hypothetical protein ACFYUJ_39065 [Streptomyces sp. NPDC004520]|uniref:hypothetical protein n=1 Tax=Streptomyces sp. NPDC004520 TaxID=3364702 RepID=UPI0036791E82
MPAQAPLLPAYRVSRHHYDGTITAQHCTAAEADALLASHLFTEDEVTADPGLTGRITLSRSVTGPRSATDPTPVTVTRSTFLDPLHAPKPTPRQYEDLCIVQAPRGRTVAVLAADGRVDAGSLAIPPAATTRLLSRGWLSVTDTPTGPPQVTVSCAGLIAMTHHSHQISIVSGSAQYTDHRGIERTGGWITNAWCTCGHWKTTVAGDRSPVRTAARHHRREHLQAALDTFA